MWTVYFSPTDFPGKWVVRQSWIWPGGQIQQAENPAIVAKSLAEARKVIPKGLVRTDRHAEDDIVIIEVWF